MFLLKSSYWRKKIKPNNTYKSKFLVIFIIAMIHLLKLTCCSGLRRIPDGGLESLSKCFEPRLKWMIDSSILLREFHLNTLHNTAL